MSEHELIIKIEEIETPYKCNEKEGESAKVIFKKKRRKNICLRRNSSAGRDDEPDSQKELNKIEEIKEKQRLRQRPNGISVEVLARGGKVSGVMEMDLSDANDKVNGGLVNLKNLKSLQNSNDNDYCEVNIGTQFSAETNKRDEDEEMIKYIEEELQKRKGFDISKLKDDEYNLGKYLTPEEAALLALPEHLRQSSSNRSEEMLSNQMLNGIPEIDLGIDVKIRNIEATEEAKQKLLRDKKHQNDHPSQFVPTNMAVNFMQHNRFNVEESSEQKRLRLKFNKNQNSQYGTNGVKRATDDYHYDKFKKQFRRY